MSGDGFSAVVHGLQEILTASKKAEELVKGAVAAAIYQQALFLMEKSVPLVPVEHGTLRRSHYVAPPESIDDPMCEVGYGTDYAVYVHERTERHHPVGQAMFLKQPLDQMRGRWTDDVGKRAKTNLERGVTLKSVPRTQPTRPRTEGLIGKTIIK